MQSRLEDEDGISALSYTAGQIVVRKHFAKVLDGYETSMAAILTAERIEAVDIAIKYSSVDRQAESIPSLHLVTVKNASSKATKSNGESCLAADVDNFWPSALAQESRSLQVKTAVYIDRPLLWRGGQLQNL